MTGPAAAVMELTARTALTFQAFACLWASSYLRIHAVVQVGSHVRSNLALGGGTLSSRRTCGRSEGRASPNPRRLRPLHPGTPDRIGGSGLLESQDGRRGSPHWCRQRALVDSARPCLGALGYEPGASQTDTWCLPLCHL